MFGSPKSLNFKNALKTLWYTAQLALDDEEEQQKRLSDWIMHFNIATNPEEAYNALHAMLPNTTDVSGIIQQDENATGWLVFDQIFGPLTNMAEKPETP